MQRHSDLPADFDHLLAELALQPEHVRQLWRYALALMMLDDEKARVVGTRRDDGQEILAVWTVAGEDFEVVRPEMSEEVERLLLEQMDGRESNLPLGG